MQNEFFHIPEPVEPEQPINRTTYQTGSTRPPKNNRGLIAFLLISVIVLIGAVTLLGAMNIHMFRQLNGDSPKETLDISIFHEDTDNTIATGPSMLDRNHKEDIIDIATSPTSVENVTVEGGMSLQDIYESCIQSVVSISCSYRGGSSTGTGVVLTADGYIVTNAHVVEGAQSIRIRFHSDMELEAELVGMDVVSDLAVLWVEADDLAHAQLGDSSVLRVGDAVVAIGDPLGEELRGSMTDGIVSAINRDVNVDGRVMNLIQTNAALNSGNSGGPLINCYGQVIGINTMKMGDSMSVAGVEGLGFAIPSNTVHEIVNQLISQGFVSGRPYIGIEGEGVSSFYQFYYGLPYGLYITQVEADSPADKIGLQAGDILLTVGNTRISGVADYESALYGYEPGDALDIVIYRNGRQYSATLIVGEANS